MCMTMSQRTKISPWGNSEAVRIPCVILKAAGLASGDDVNVSVNERGNIELVPQERAHRRIKPMRGVTYDSLFAGYEGNAAFDSKSMWPDGVVGAEREAWGL